MSSMSSMSRSGIPAVVLALALMACGQADEQAAPTPEAPDVVPDVVEVPDVTGASYGEARSALEAVGLRASRQFVDDDTAEPDTVVGTEPAAGADVEEGARVNVLVVRPQAEEPEAEEEAEEIDLEMPDPSGRVAGRCSTLLAHDKDLDEEGRYKFIASVDAINEGNIGIEVEVWAEFTLLGAEPVRFVETVDVPIGETVTVHFDENVTRDQWQRHGDTGRDCDIGGEIVDYDFDSLWGDDEEESL